MTSSTRGTVPEGFSLVEVMVAVTVVGIGVTAALSAFGMALNAAQSAEQRIQVVQRLEEEAVMLRARARLEDEGVVPGQFVGSWPFPAGSSWQARITQQEEPALSDLVLEAVWSRSGRTQSASLETEIPAPPDQ